MLVSFCGVVSFGVEESWSAQSFALVTLITETVPEKYSFKFSYIEAFLGSGSWESQFFEGKVAIFCGASTFGRAF
jgi:hypothetical protein